MENLKKLLGNPFDGKNVNFQDKCLEIAKELFCNYCINCGETEYYFAEIEFYYYEKGKWDKDWNKVTYERNGYNAGELFYHLSGVDICFESKYDNDKAYFGGILIRAIKEISDKNNDIIAGPLTCKDVILNKCKKGNMPKLSIISHNSHKRNLTPKATYRALGKDALEKHIDKPYNLCFFDASKENNWNPTKFRYDKNGGKIKSQKGSYKLDRFNE